MNKQMNWGCASAVSSPPHVRKWELVNPEGVAVVEPVQVNPHPETLEGKTVALYWNGKHNGDKFLTRMAELLTEKVKGVKIVKLWQVKPETAELTESVQEGKAKAVAIAAFKPDIVIASQGD